MTEFGAPQEPEQPQQPAQQPQLDLPVRSMQELRDMDTSAKVRGDFDRAAAAEDIEEANQHWERMKQMGGRASLEVLSEGGDPARETRPIGMFLHPQLEMARRQMFAQQQQAQLNTFIRDNPELGQVRDYMSGVLDEYQDRNTTALGDWQPDLMTEQQRFDYMMKLQPVRRDPNEVANMRQMLVKADQLGKQVYPEFSVFKHPDTREWAGWLNREAGVTGLGYLVSGEQELEMGVAGRTAYVAAEFIETATDIPLAVGYQAWEWADQGLRGLGLPSISPPINYIEGPNGEIYFNEERPHPGYLEAAQGMWTMAMGGDVAKSVAKLNRVRMLEKAQRHGFTHLVHGSANVAGAFLGFGLPAGAFMTRGQQLFAGLGKKGLALLGGLGVKGAESARALHLVDLWAGSLGGATGLGTFQATAFGKQQGYLNQYLHGMAMFPVLATLGHYGPRLERALMKHAKMPPKVAGMLSEGMVMGVPFATLEMANVGLWEHLRNPNESTLQIYLKNIFGAMLFKGMFGRTTPSMQQQAFLASRFHVERSNARAAFAEDLAAGRVDPARVLARFPQMEAGDFTALGEIIIRKKAAQNPVERQRLQEEQEAFEAKLDVKEYGLESKVLREAEQIGLEETEGAPQRVRKEFVPGKEPKRIRDEEGERRQAERRKTKLKERLDPIEEPDFGDRPEAEKKLILAAESAVERKQIANRLDEGAERYQVLPEKGGLWKVVDSRTGEAEMTAFSSRALAEKWADTARLTERRVAPERREPPIEQAEMPGPETSTRIPTAEEQRRGAKIGPGSSQAVPGLQIEAVEGARRTTLDEIRAEMGGRLPRKGIRVPFTAVRIGGKPGDPVRPGFRKGRLGRRGAEGIFQLFQNLIRTKGGRDLITDSHEWSHAMQRHMQADRGGKEFVQAAKAWVRSLDPAMVKEEFPKILEGYRNWERLPLTTKGMEVWAEWHARELLGDVRLEGEAPRLTAYFRDQLRQPGNAGIRAQFNRIKDKILQYTLIGAEGRLDVSFESAQDLASESLRATQPTKFEQMRDRVIRNFFDDIITLKRGTEKWLEATNTDPMKLEMPEDPGRMWDALRMTAPKQAEQFVMNGISTPSGQHVRGMRDILKSVKGRERPWTAYMVAVLNAQRLMRGKTATLSMADYVSEIRRLQTENPDFRGAARELKAWTDTIVDWVAGAGNLPIERAENIKKAYVLWIPFFRLMEGAQAHGVGGRKIAPVGEGIGRVKEGGSERIREPLNAMFDAVTMMISNAHRNMVVSALYKMAVGYEAGGMATVVKKSVVPKTHPMREIIDAMERQIEMPEEAQFFFEDMVSALKDADALDTETLTLFAQKVIPAGERNIVAFTPRLTEAEITRTARGDPELRKIIEEQQGKNLWLEIDPPIYEVLIGLDVPPLHNLFGGGWLDDALRKASGLRRFFATGVAPGFTVANMFRDAMSQPLFTQDGSFAPGGGIVRMIRGGITYHGEKGPNSIREIYDVMGVRISSFFNEGTRQKMIGEARGIIQKGKAAAEYLESIFAVPENYLRIDEFRKVYERALSEGKSDRHARLLALEAGREITVNFARGGVVSRMINGMTPYFNASLQGQRKVWRQLALGGDGRNDAQRARIQKAAFLNGMANITVPTMILWWMNHDQEWYQDLPDWRKMLFFNVKLSDEHILSFPKPFEAGAWFGGIPEAFMETWVNENGRPPDLSTVLFDGLFPYLKGPGDLLPALIQPILELTTNFDFFRRRPLTPDWIASNRIPADQATFYTSESAKILSRALNGAVSPIAVEKIIGGYTSGTGTYLLRTLDEMTNLKNHPGFTLNPLQRFFAQTHRSGLFQNRLYEISKILDRRAGSKVASAGELLLRARINQVKSKFSRISRSVQTGGMDSIEAERLKYEIARPIVERYEELQR